MGMFDSFYDAQGNEWQTKAFDCVLARFDIGDPVPFEVSDFQVQCLGELVSHDFTDGLATIQGGRLTGVPSARDPRLPLYNYSAHLIEEAKP